APATGSTGAKSAPRYYWKRASVCLPGTEKPPEKCQMSHESQRGRAVREEARSKTRREQQEGG
ncbi:hypothetical protein P7K49_014900, partial [Saguinus oedipus]